METRSSYLCVTPPKSSVNAFLMKNIKKHCHKKVIACFDNLDEENFFKVAAFVTFPTSITALFEIQERFKGHILNELRVSLNVM